jgi:hypothetical protein
MVARMIPLLFLCIGLLIAGVYAEPPARPWLAGQGVEGVICDRIPLPRGFERVAVREGSFGDWLRHLPLKREGTPVYLYDGRKKGNQNAHIAVIDMDMGTGDLQQCADAIIRLRGEYLYAAQRFSAIHFRFTNGDDASFMMWASGYRPEAKGNKVTWIKTRAPDQSYKSFREYLRTVFIYAGTSSLSRELAKRGNMHDMRIGDVFIEPGFPGHAVLVVDMAEDAVTGKRVFLLAQSYMPAQDIHILRNPTNEVLSPWYDLDSGAKLKTPEWVFTSPIPMGFSPE